MTKMNHSTRNAHNRRDYQSRSHHPKYIDMASTASFLDFSVVHDREDDAMSVLARISACFVDGDLLNDNQRAWLERLRTACLRYKLTDKQLKVLADCERSIAAKLTRKRA